MTAAAGSYRDGALRGLSIALPAWIAPLPQPVQHHALLAASPSAVLVQMLVLDSPARYARMVPVALVTALVTTQLSHK